MSAIISIAASGNVVVFRGPSDEAVGRDRRYAARIITRRLRELVATADFRRQYPGYVADLRVGRMLINFTRAAEGMYFRIDGRGGILMSGYIDPVRPGKYDGGRLHVMTWNRGWEAELFRPGA